MKECRVKDICIKGSSNLKQKDVEGKKGLYPVYGASGIISSIDTYHQENEYIAIVKDGSGIGRVSFMPPKSSVIGTMQYILPKEGYDIRYIGYCLQSLGLNKYKQGAAIPHIYFRDYGERNIIVTDNINEQRRIVSYFDSSFKLIDEIKDKALKSLTEAKALFQSALAEAMEPKEGWEEKTLGEICSKIGSGATPKGGKKIYIKNGVSIIRSLNVHRNFFKYEDLAHIDNNSAKKLDNVIVKNNDVLFNITGASIARCCVVPKDVLPARVNQHVSIIRIKDGIVPNFLCYLLNSKSYQMILLGIGESGSTRQAITKSNLEHFVIAYPPLDTQKQIVAHLDNLSSKVRAIEEKYQKMVEECDALKQAMLRDVFE